MLSKKTKQKMLIPFWTLILPPPNTQFSFLV